MVSTLCEPGYAGDLGVVKPDMPTLFGCEILAKTQAFVLDEGVSPTVEWVFKDPNGNPINLSACFDGASASTSCSESTSGSLDSKFICASHSVGLRIGEPFTVSKHCPPLDVEAVVVDATNGVVRATLPISATARAGVYLMNWAINNSEGVPIYINRALMSVEPSLYSIDYGRLGPPTVNEIRITLRDTPGENLRLNELEFSASEILLAIIEPIREFNETNPRLRRFYQTTHTFPFRHYWLMAITGYLLEYAANFYRREKFPYNAGGISVDDLNKEPEYLRASQMKLGEWRTWMLRTKVSMNASQCYGSVGSPYRYRGMGTKT